MNTYTKLECGPTWWSPCWI